MTMTLTTHPTMTKALPTTTSPASPAAPRRLPRALRLASLCLALLAATLSTRAGAQAATAPLVQIGPGDTISLQVFGQPDMTGSIYVGEDGTVSVPLVGRVKVAGLSPAEAGARIEAALREGNVLVDPHVTVAVAQSINQRVSVLGEVGTPGRYPIDAGTTPLDLLAQAGGVKETGSDVVFLVRRMTDGTTERLPIDLAPLGADGEPQVLPTLRAGDVLFVPVAQDYFVSGEVIAPARYRFHQGLTVAEAVAKAGGVNERGSDSRIEIRRQRKDGKYETVHANPSDVVQPGDIVKVKGKLF
jgi:polysaccharide export outer membrane protein